MLLIKAPVTGVTGRKLGAVLSTVKVVLGPEAGAVFPARSLAVPVAIEIPRVPSPLIPLMVTMRVVPVPESTLTVPLAVKVLFRVMLPAARVLVLKCVSE